MEHKIASERADKLRASIKIGAIVSVDITMPDQSTRKIKRVLVMPTYREYAIFCYRELLSGKSNEQDAGRGTNSTDFDVWIEVQKRHDNDNNGLHRASDYFDLSN